MFNGFLMSRSKSHHNGGIFLNELFAIFSLKPQNEISQKLSIEINQITRPISFYMDQIGKKSTQTHVEQKKGAQSNLKRSKKKL